MYLDGGGFLTQLEGRTMDLRLVFSERVDGLFIGCYFFLFLLQEWSKFGEWLKM